MVRNVGLLDDDRIYPEPSYYQLGLQAICLIYPLYYEYLQLQKLGFTQFLATNLAEFMHILFGYTNIYFQIYHGTWAVSSKFFIIIVVFITMFNTFEKLRVFQQFSYIVTMIREVIKDLQIFLVFFVIVIIMFSNILDVVGHSSNPEYETIGPLWGNLFATLRLSLGDFDFSQITDY